MSKGFTSSPTQYTHVNQLLSALVPKLQAILGDKLLAVYLYGSLVIEAFDDVSDVDLLAVTAETISDEEFMALDAMHQQIVRDDPQWRERIEIDYVSQKALRTFKVQRSLIGRISPGEPFHMITAGIDFLADWYMVREKGVTLYGEAPETYIGHISKGEFVQAVKDATGYWREAIQESLDFYGQSYAIIMLWRSLYTVTYGEQVSKVQATTWAAEQFPEWADLIGYAMLWRSHQQDTHDSPLETYPMSKQLLIVLIEKIENL